MAVFASPAHAVSAGVELVALCEEEIEDDLPLLAGVGIETGPAGRRRRRFPRRRPEHGSPPLLGRGRRRGAAARGPGRPCGAARRHRLHAAWPGRAQGVRQAGRARRRRARSHGLDPPRPTLSTPSRWSSRPRGRWQAADESSRGCAGHGVAHAAAPAPSSSSRGLPGSVRRGWRRSLPRPRSRTPVGSRTSAQAALPRRSRRPRSPRPPTPSLQPSSSSTTSTRSARGS